MTKKHSLTQRFRFFTVMGLNGVIALISLSTSSAKAGISPSAELKEYQSASNQYYWKNRKPFEGYWQQDVHYTIKAVVDDAEQSISGSEKLIYWNNSPNALNVLYFHLYQNAFTPNSYLSDMRRTDKVKSVYGEHEQKGIGTAISNLKVNGTPANYILDNTILIIKLSESIPSGEGALIEMDFKTYWDKDDGGNIRRRMKTFRHGGADGKQFIHFDGVHWYPRIAVYDRKFGWTNDQHLGKEFYGDFGVYEVSLDFPSQYVVEATGVLQNESEMYPGDLRKRLDISNYKTQRDVYTNPIPIDGKRKNWRFKAINVHDFAFTADPTYRIGEVVWNGIRCIALAQEENAHNWQPTAQFVADVVKTYSEKVGMFGYPKMIAADARDGMEYPMLTLNSGSWPGHQYVIAHEVGHNWFFGMVGNNETYRASLDEGFTQFLTAMSLKHINQVEGNPNRMDDRVVFNGYMNHAIHDNSARLNIHSDHYNSAVRHGGGYGQVYYKTATMLYNLEYVLGDELFAKAFKNYFNQWKFCHPYWEDFRNSVIDYTGVNLNLFFDEWIEGNSTIDYKVGKIKKGDNGKYAITLHRLGSSMPLDVTITSRDGTKYNYYVPNSYWRKKTDATVLPNWIGWDLVKPTYTMYVAVPGGIKDVEIDPSGRMGDINRLNNTKKLPVEWKFSTGGYKPVSFRKYIVHYGPSLLYNHTDGAKVGARFDGDFYGTDHQLDLGLWYNTGLGNNPNVDPSNPDRMSYSLQYSKKFKRYNRFGLDSRFLDGWTYNALNWTRHVGNGYVYLTASARQRRNAEYLINPEFANDPDLWETGTELSYFHPVKGMNGSGSWMIKSYGTSVGSDYNYAFASAEWKYGQNLGKTRLNMRWFGQWMTGTIAPESMMLLSGGNVRSQMNSPFTRSTWIFDQYRHNRGGTNFHQGGGLNLRGYAGYAATNTIGTDTFTIFGGSRGTAVNMEWDFGSLIKVKRPKWLIIPVGIQPYLFADAGILGNSNDQWSGIRVDAGLGANVAMSLPRVGGSLPFNLRFDFPFFLNRIPEEQSDYLAFRYLIGINRAF